MLLRSRIVAIFVLLAFLAIVLIYTVNVPVFEHLRTVLALWAMG